MQTISQTKTEKPRKKFMAAFDPNTCSGAAVTFAFVLPPKSKDAPRGWGARLFRMESGIPDVWVSVAARATPGLPLPVDPDSKAKAVSYGGDLFHEVWRSTQGTLLVAPPEGLGAAEALAVFPTPCFLPTLPYSSYLAIVHSGKPPKAASASSAPSPNAPARPTAPAQAVPASDVTLAVDLKAVAAAIPKTVIGFAALTLADLAALMEGGASTPLTCELALFFHI